MKHPKLLVLLLAVCLGLPSLAQTNQKIEDLKSQRGQLQEQIKRSESLLLSTQKDVKSQLGDLALINSQLEERRKYIRVKRLTDKYNTITITTYQFVFGALFFLPFFLLYGTEGVTAELFKWENLLPLLSLATLCSCLCFGLWIYSIGNLGITRTNIFSALIPAISAIGAFALGQENLSGLRIAGIAIVIAGVILAQKEKKE